MTLHEFLLQHRIDFAEGGTHRHVRHGWIGVNPCPKCNSTSYHAGLTEDCSRAACWRCGGLNPFHLLAHAAKLTVREVLEAIESPQEPAGARRSPSKPRGHILYPPGLQALTRPYREFLRGRGFDPASIAVLWGVRATGPAGLLAWRLWIPIHLDEQVVSWTTRAIGDRTPRYVSAAPEQEAVDHKSLLYGEDLVEHSVVIVEGPTDVWRIGPGAVCQFGLNTSPKQIERLSRYPIRTICFDSQPPAQRRAERLADVLQQFSGRTDVIVLETGDDPADAEPAEIEQLRNTYLE